MNEARQVGRWPIILLACGWVLAAAALLILLASGTPSWPLVAVLAITLLLATINLGWLLQGDSSRRTVSDLIWRVRLAALATVGFVGVVVAQVIGGTV